ncbi:MAG: class I SAM-dependent methyltransferase [Thermodesulfobacteriota bacterium]|nr:class I SAM-dependent methyltransferase [Thermodesulfobacteriota bacterium]
MQKVHPDWWKVIFDKTYLITDARTVCDDALTCREVDFLWRVLDLDKSWPILDLCGGQGRHSLELSRRGFKDVTVLDYSKILIELGREMAQKEGLNTLFVRKDARDTGLPDERFKIIIIMASSFGYFNDESEDEQMVEEVFRLLMPGGSFFMDLPDREYVLKNITSQSWHEANDEILVCRQRSVTKDIVYTREIAVSKKKGLIRDENYSTRLYSPEKITSLLTSAGFHSVNVQKDFVSHERRDDYGAMTNRMVVIAHKK